MLRRLLLGQLLLLALLWWLLIVLSARLEISDETLQDEAPALRAIGLAAAALLDRPEALRAALLELDRNNTAAGSSQQEPLLRTYTVLHHGDRLLFASEGLPGPARRPHPPGVSDLQAPAANGEVARWRVITEQVATADGLGLRASALIPEGPLFLLLALQGKAGLFLPLLISMPLLLLPAALSLHWALRPWRRLSAGLAGRDSADLSPLPLPGRQRELRPLVDAMNAWLRQLRELRDREQRFLADAAHELRTPLTAVQLGAQRLQGALERGDGAQVQAALQAVLRGSARSARLAHQLLALLRAEAEATAPTETLDLARWLPELIADLVPLAQQRGVQLGLEGADEAQQHLMQAHPDGLQSLVVNLVDNAIRHAPRGSAVRIGLQRDGERLQLLVDDEGPGIAAERRESLLLRFTRGEAQPGDTGSGLGLAIALSVARLHGGELRLLSSPAGGLRVEVKLPAANARGPA